MGDPAAGVPRDQPGGGGSECTFFCREMKHYTAPIEINVQVMGNVQVTSVLLA